MSFYDERILEYYKKNIFWSIFIGLFLFLLFLVALITVVVLFLQSDQNVVAFSSVSISTSILGLILVSIFFYGFFKKNHAALRLCEEHFNSKFNSAIEEKYKKKFSDLEINNEVVSVESKGQDFFTGNIRILVKGNNKYRKIVFIVETNFWFFQRESSKLRISMMGEENDGDISKNNLIA